MSDLSITLLGPPHVAVNGVPLRVDTRKAVALLAYLAVNGSEARESLATLLWPESDRSRARAALRRTLSVLNKGLDRQWLDVDRTTVALAGEGIACDVNAFREAVAATALHDHGRSAVCPECIEPLATAARLQQGDFLSGFALRDSVQFDEWQAAEAETLRRERTQVLDRLVRVLLDARDFETAIRHARQRVALDALDEPARRRLMLLHAWNGERSEAIRQYRDCAAILDRELGVAPVAETTNLYQALVDGRLPPPPATPSATDGNLDATAATDAPAGARQGSSGDPVPGAPDRATRTHARSGRRGDVHDLVLVGRDEELRRLHDCLAGVGTDGRLLVLTGETGVGKTRLLDDLVATARARGATVFSVRCHPGESHLTFAVISEALRLAAETDAARLVEVGAHWLAEAGRLQPDLAALAGTAPSGAALESPGASTRFFEAVCRVLEAALVDPASGLPGVLTVDDLQWADDASVELLTYLARRLPGRPLLVAGSWREEEMPAEHALRRLRDDAVAAGWGTGIRVERLSPADITHLVTTVTGRPDAEALAARLYEETEGLALFVVEYLAAITAAPHLPDLPLPQGVRTLLRGRVTDLDDVSRQLLTTAAVIGRSFDPHTVVRVSGRSEDEAVVALEDLAARGLIRDTHGEARGSATPSYDFSHEKLRAVVYEGASLARRRLLHGRVADALSDEVRGTSAEHARAAEIARHEQLAGREQQAAARFAVAGHHARSLFANREALGHYRTALALGHPETAELHEAIGDLETLEGSYETALRAYETAAGQSVKPQSAAAIEHRIGVVHLRRGDLAAAATHLHTALDVLAGHPPGALLARVHADLSLLHAYRDRLDPAREHGELALRLAERAEDRRGVAQARNILGILARRRGDLVEARRQLEMSAHLADQLPDPAARIAALNNLARATAETGDLDVAVAYARSALELCTALGDRHRQAALLNNLADLLHLAGDETEWITHLKEAVRLFAEVGESGPPQPEIWKLAEW